MSNRSRALDEVVSIGTRRASIAAACVGRLVEITQEGVLLVEYAGNSAGPLPALLATPASRELLTVVAAERRGVVLVFDDGDSLKPLIVGLVSPISELASPAAAIAVKVDGKTISFCAQDEVALRCGQASLTLRKDGKVILRGATIESRAAGTNRIKGATVKVN